MELQAVLNHLQNQFLQAMKEKTILNIVLISGQNADRKLNDWTTLIASLWLIQMLLIKKGNYHALFFCPKKTRETQLP